MEEVLITPSCHIWESLCNEQSNVQTRRWKPPCLMSTQGSPVCPSAPPVQPPHITHILFDTQKESRLWNEQLLCKFSMSCRFWKVHYKRDRRLTEDGAVLWPGWINAIFPKIKNFVFISFDVGYLLHYLKWRWILAETSPEHTKHHSNAYHHQKCHFF